MAETTIERRLRALLVLALPVVLMLGSAVFVSGCSRDGNAQTADAGDSDSAQTEGAENEATEGENEEGKEGEEGEDNGKAPIPVQVASIGTGEVSAYITSTANLVAEEQVRILAEAEGRVSALMVDEGQYIKQGQHLARLVRDEAEIALNKAQHKLDNAKLAHERGVDLADKELISREEFDQLSMDFEIAQQELADAEWQLSKTIIRAPFSGVVSERMIQVGQHVRLGDELFQVTDFNPLIARIFLPEKDVLSLNEGQDVRITLNADSSVRFGAFIRQISPIVDTETGTVKVTVEANSPPSQVRPGSFVTIDIVRETRADVVLVPRDAVLRELQKAHVFVAEDDAAVKRVVTLGLEEGDWVQALSGVEPGEQVIVAGQGGLRDGSPVKLLEDDSAQEG